VKQDWGHFLSRFACAGRPFLAQRGGSALQLGNPDPRRGRANDLFALAGGYLRFEPGCYEIAVSIVWRKNGCSKNGCGKNAAPRRSNIFDFYNSIDGHVRRFDLGLAVPKASGVLRKTFCVTTSNKKRYWDFRVWATRKVGFVVRSIEITPRGSSVLARDRDSLCHPDTTASVAGV
jgi:hypothetical protein